jgi:hypothetical protein
VNTHELTHARHDPGHCLAPGLFRSFKRGERKKLKLDVTYAFGDDSIRFWGPEPLGADDLRILQGLVAMAGPSGLVLSPEPRTDAARQLRLSLEPKWEAVQQDAMVVKGSFGQLVRELGYTDDGGKQFRTVRASIERLWAVSVIVERSGNRQGFRILSDYASDEHAGKLYVALNPLFAQAVLGGRQHVRINMNEVRAIKSDPARLIHQRLCGWIDPAKIGRVELDTLCGYIWPDAATPEAMKKRRQTARKALAELAAIGWMVSEYAKGKWEIKRPGRKAVLSNRL